MTHPTPAKVEACETCRFWLKDGEACRRYPPTMLYWREDVANGTQHTVSPFFPNCFATTWYGEYQENPNG